MRNEHNIITLEHVSAGYGRKAVVHDVNFNVKEGSIVAILGFNGTGKSTLLRTICGLQEAVAGKVILDDKLLRDHKAIDRAKKIAVVLSGRGDMVPALLVYEILSFARSPYQDRTSALTEEDNRIIYQVATQLGIMPFMHRPVYALSDGEAQRVSIARALVQDTPIIAMDEPTSHLDLHNKLEIFQLIRQLAQQGKTIVFTAHDIDLALAVADYALLIDTSGNGVFDATETLISSGAINQYFDQQELKFDQVSRRFVYEL